MEIQNRLKLLNEAMQTDNVDLVAVGPTPNMRYLLDFTPYPDERLCLLLLSKSEACIVVPSLNAKELATHTNIKLFSWTDSEGPFKALKQALTEIAPIKKLAFDGGMRADFLASILAAAEPQGSIPVESLLAPIRARKSEDEVDALEKASAQADLAMQAAISACQVGASEMDVAWAAETAFRINGAEKVNFALVASGPNGAFPHHNSSKRKLRNGDAIIIDIGASLNGYQSDMTRMVFLGNPSEKILRAYAAVLEANERGRAAIKPGVAAQEIDRVTRSTLEKAGYGDYFIHRTGHGLGMEVHEQPWIMAGNNQLLEPGMVFSIEPGVYIPDQFGIRIEDIVVVTENGCRTLTDSSRQLVVKG